MRRKVRTGDFVRYDSEMFGEDVYGEVFEIRDNFLHVHLHLEDTHPAVQDAIADNEHIEHAEQCEFYDLVEVTKVGLLGGDQNIDQGVEGEQSG